MQQETDTKVIDHLKNPQTHGGQYVEHVETHISHVFLTEDAAYKVKKPANFGFLDF